MVGSMGWWDMIERGVEMEIQALVRLVAAFGLERRTSARVFASYARSGLRSIAGHLPVNKFANVQRNC